MKHRFAKMGAIAATLSLMLAGYANAETACHHRHHHHHHHHHHHLSTTTTTISVS